MISLLQVTNLRRVKYAQCRATSKWLAQYSNPGFHDFTLLLLEMESNLVVGEITLLLFLPSRPKSVCLFTSLL